MSTTGTSVGDDIFVTPTVGVRGDGWQSKRLQKLSLIRRQQPPLRPLGQPFHPPSQTSVCVPPDSVVVATVSTGVLDQSGSPIFVVVLKPEQTLSRHDFSELISSCPHFTLTHSTGSSYASLPVGSTQKHDATKGVHGTERTADATHEEAQDGSSAYVILLAAVVVAVIEEPASLDDDGTGVVDWATSSPMSNCSNSNPLRYSECISEIGEKNTGKKASRTKLNHTWPARCLFTYSSVDDPSQRRAGLWWMGRFSRYVISLVDA
ncbi:hypothetical protein H072_3074 [Dactylellina haptotyla CBS 200.50]|uniref:Uncharacterized protein n=1 Tax=Dactylellina haptotyla (strain CBS 200.50) TaxID=1284197 RepID=S8BU43_DACHA|nr:hypothetical protein H072_3074 [Dactylellina haptotyla CBS 200.50]